MDLEEYEQTLDQEVQDALEIAEEARQRQYDPKPEVEMEMCEDIAERCEKLLGVDGLAGRIRELEEEGYGREEMAIMLADSFVDGEVGDYDTKAGKVDGAIRTAVALLTEGVVAAPIDGIGEVRIEENDDGTEYIRVPYFGPIRSAGGTGQALSVLVADYIRQKLEIDEFKPREEELGRYAAELELYEKEVGLQYTPKKKEVKHIVEHCPIMLDGVQTTDGEVEGFRDLERIDGNRGRGGMCLVVGEGIAQKAPKLKKYTSSLDIPGWGWLDKLSTVTTTDDDEEEDADSEDDVDESSMDDGDDTVESADDDGSLPDPADIMETLPDPSEKFLADVIAGRPVFSGPSQEGGFRLRYGRARNMGHAACGYHPATMVIVDDFIATGTQLKTEMPGKAAGAAPVDSIEGPTVRLANGELRRIDDVEEAKKVQNAVDKIVDLGEAAVPYGEFLENNHPLLPASYTHEWWVQEFKDAGGSDIDPDRINPAQAFAFAEKYDIPLHPKYTYLWHDIELDDYKALSAAIEEAAADDVAYISDDHRETLEALLIPHEWDDNEGRLYIDDEEFTVLERCCSTDTSGETVYDHIEEAAGVEVRARAPVRIGTRMGRPEKSNRREMSPSVHALFPIGDAGGDQRDIEKAADNNEGADADFDGNQDDDYLGRGTIKTTLATRKCPECSEELYLARCPDCDVRTEKQAYCWDCGRSGEPGETCQRCDATFEAASTQELDIYNEFRRALDNIGERRNSFQKLKGVKGLTSSSKLPEPLEKGILRAKHDVDVFRDGTARYDMVDLPLTEFSPAELDMTVEEAKELGYEETVDGEELTDPEQRCELRIQDVILSRDCGEYLLQVADFVDELLQEYYDMEPFYEVETVDDLIGELVVGLAPHTSAGVMARIIGFTDASVGYGHPFFHAAKRRNCFHPDTTVDYAEGDSTIVSKSIKDLFEDQFDEANAQRDDFGAVYSETKDDVRVASVNSEGETVLKELTHVQRTPAPDVLVSVETESGRSLTVTPDHDVLVYDTESEQLTPKPARFLRSDDVFARPTGEWAEAEVDLDSAAGKYGAFIGGDANGQDEFGTSYLDPIAEVEFHEPECEYVYNVTVEDTHTLPVNGLWSKQCDGDEDCVMLLMDGLLNFSQEFLPDRRGKRTMDAPLVMSTVIDPYEIDDEAHNVDIPDEYPREFYEATYDMPGPKDLDDEADIPIAEDILDDPQGFGTSLETSTIDGGPTNTAYKTLGPMDEKTEAQLSLAAKTRAINEDIVAEKVIEKHFFPDIIGNLTAFARQEFRCPACNNKYRRPPLNNECEECGGELILTLHEGSVKKYIDIATEIAERYGLREYTHQRLEALDERIEMIFEDDNSKQTGLGDFM